MANPAREARNKAQAIWSGATVFRRGRKSITHQHPTEPNRFMFDNSIGNLHIEGSETEIDTAIVTSTGAWQYEMTQADYQVHMRNVFSAGNLIEYRDPVSDEWVIFDPQSINWIDENTSRQQIATKQNVNAVINDDVISFPAGYGEGRHFQYQCQTGRLRKIITIDNLSDLPAPTVQGNDIWFESEFTLSTSTGVTIWLDGVEWTKANGVRVQTSNRIEFRDATGTNVFWSLDYPRAWGSSQNNETPQDNEIFGEMEVRAQAGNNLFITVRIPYNWMLSATYPVYLDPTIEYQPAVSADDAYSDESQTSSVTDGTDLFIGTGSTGTTPTRTVGLRFDGVDLDSTDTIDTAYLMVYATFSSATTAPIEIYGDDADDPAVWVDSSHITSQITDTTANATFSIDVTFSASTHERLHSSGSDEIKTIIAEIIARGGWNALQAMRFRVSGQSGIGGFVSKPFESYDSSASNCPILHIEYSTAPTDVLAQEGFRFRNDDGTETTATWIDSQDTSITINPETKFRLRALIDETGASVTPDFQLEYRKKISSSPDVWGDWVSVE
jgi:hypothetical protein